MTEACALGAQSYSFRTFDLAGSTTCLKELGLDFMEFCAVHFPPDPGHDGLPAVLDFLRAEGVRPVCYGVEAFSADGVANARKFEFAKALGVDILTADPAPDAFDSLDRLCEQYGVRIAIHNHGPRARYDTVRDTLDAVRGHSPLIGACVDTGHALRSGECPHEVIEQLGSRVISVHLKDWTVGGEEQILGEGDLDLAAVARALKGIGFDGPIVMEYENSPENPVPDMRIGLRNWRAAWGA